jgi:hypothetical protein
MVVQKIRIFIGAPFSCEILLVMILELSWIIRFFLGCLSLFILDPPHAFPGLHELSFHTFVMETACGFTSYNHPGLLVAVFFVKYYHSVLLGSNVWSNKH